MTTFASFVADEAAGAVRTAAREIGPSADGVSEDAASLVYAPAELAAELRAAIGAITDIDRLTVLATSALATLPSVSSATANRTRQGDNQAALVELVRALATIALAERTGTESYRDRTVLTGARDVVVERLDARSESASTATFRALQSLRAAVVQHTDAQLRTLPRVVRASPGAVRPSLALAYAIYEDIGRADDIVGRNQLRRPGFIPATPIEVLDE